MRRKTALLLFTIILLGAHAAHAQTSCPDGRVSPILTGPFSSPKFKFDAPGFEPQAKLTFKWTVSTGVITSGQDSNEIVVDVARAKGTFLTVTVAVDGLPTGCPNEFSESVRIIDGPVAVMKDEYGRISFRDEKERLLRFARLLRKNRGSKADIIYFSGGRRRALRARRYLIQSGIRPTRINIFSGGYSQDVTIQLYLELRRPEVP